MIPTKSHRLLDYSISAFYSFALKLFDKELKSSLNKILSSQSLSDFSYTAEFVKLLSKRKALIPVIF